MRQPLQRFVEERQDRWQDLGALVTGAKGSVGRLDAPTVRHLGTLYRTAVADLAYARRAYPKDPVTLRLEELVGRSRPLVYGTVVERRSVAHFATTGYWQGVRARPWMLLVAALAMFLPAIGIGLWSHANPDDAGRVAQISPVTAGVADGPRDPDTQKLTDTGVNTALSAQIFTNNARVALAAFALGLTGGVLTLFSVAFNGAILGLVAGLSIEGGHGEALWRLIVPHGVLELSLLVVAAAAGLRVGWALVHPGHLTRAESLAREGRAAVEVALGSAALLVPCGVVEGFVTPRGLTLPYALAVGLGLGALYWAMVLWRGRPDLTAVPPT